MGWQGRLAVPESTKEERFRAVAEAVAAIVSAAGVRKVTVSSVARRAHVSRAWIYKYVGDDPAILLSHAARLYALAFSDLARSRRAEDVGTWRALVAEATRDGLRDTLAAPWCVQLYFRHRHAPDPIGAAIRDVEERYVDVFVADLPPGLRRADARCFAE